MFFTFLKPACRRKSHALALRTPLLQCATISVARVELIHALGQIAQRDQLRAGMLQI